MSMQLDETPSPEREPSEEYFAQLLDRHASDTDGPEINMTTQELAYVGAFVVQAVFGYYFFLSRRQTLPDVAPAPVTQPQPALESAQ